MIVATYIYIELYYIIYFIEFTIYIQCNKSYFGFLYPSSMNPKMSQI